MVIFYVKLNGWFLCYLRVEELIRDFNIELMIYLFML